MYKYQLYSRRVNSNIVTFINVKSHLLFADGFLVGVNGFAFSAEKAGRGSGVHTGTPFTTAPIESITQKSKRR